MYKEIIGSWRQYYTDCCVPCFAGPYRAISVNTKAANKYCRLLAGWLAGWLVGCCLFDYFDGLLVVWRSLKWILPWNIFWTYLCFQLISKMATNTLNEIKNKIKIYTKKPSIELVVGWMDGWSVVWFVSWLLLAHCLLSVCSRADCLMIEKISKCLTIVEIFCGFSLMIVFFLIMIAIMLCS